MGRNIKFFDGAESSTTPTIGNIVASDLVTYANDAAFEAAESGAPSEGNIYSNTTDNTIRYYDGTSWNEVPKDAASLSYDNSTSLLTATDVQAAIDEIEARDDTNEADIADLQTLSGSPGATDHGTFTGAIIPDNSDTKESLQSLETAVETGANTNLSNLDSPTSINQDLLFDSDNARAIGDTTNKASAVYSENIDLASETGLIDNVWGGDAVGIIVDGNTTDATNSGMSGITLKSTQGAGVSLGIFTTDVDAGGTQSAPIFITTGFQSGTGNTGEYFQTTGDADGSSGNTGNSMSTTGNAANGNSGNNIIETGTATGTRGSIRLRDGSQGTIGHIWTSTDTAGSGSWQAPSAASPVLTVVTKDAAYTLLSTDDVVLVDTDTIGAFTLTLPAAASNSGKVYQIKKITTDFLVCTIDGNASETIDGDLTTTVNTNGEVLKIVSDGTNWQILDRKTKSEWESFTPTGSWSTNTTWTGERRRVGDSWEFNIKAAFTGAPDNVAFTIDMPDSLTIDESKLVVDPEGKCRLQGGAHLWNDNISVENILFPAYSGTNTEFTLWRMILSTTYQYVLFTRTAPATIATSDSLQVNGLLIPVTGWKA